MAVYAPTSQKRERLSTVNIFRASSHAGAVILPDHSSPQFSRLEKGSAGLVHEGYYQVCSGRWLRVEGDINEVVAGLEGVGREEAGGAVTAVSIDAGIRGRGQRAVCIVGGEVVSGVRISSGRMVGRDIGGAGRYRRPERRR